MTAAESSGWAPSGSANSWECRAAQGRQKCPEEAQEPTWGTAKAGTLTMLGDDAQRMTAAESSVGDSGSVAGLLCFRESFRRAKLPILLLGGF